MVARDANLLDDPWMARPCLTHADCNPTNILVREVGGHWQVAGLLDWEFAFVGGPAFDLGNLLRRPAGGLAGFAAGVADGYRAAGGRLADGWARKSALADLYSWADFLARPGSGPALVRDASAMMAWIAAGAAAGEYRRHPLCDLQVLHGGFQLLEAGHVLVGDHFAAGLHADLRCIALQVGDQHGADHLEEF